MAWLRKCSLLFASAALQVTGAFAQGTPPKVEPYLFWFGDCRKAMAIRMVVDGRTVYRSRFPVCRMQRSEASVERERVTRVFHFAGGHNFQGQYRTARQEQIEGNIWQAGTDKHSLYLGIAFAAHHRVLLNTLHLVESGKSTWSILDRGIIVETYPLKSAN